MDSAIADNLSVDSTIVDNLSLDYSNDLKFFLFSFGINKTSNFDLYDMANLLELPIKICMKNEFKSLKNKVLRSENIYNKNTLFIINLQDSDKKGSHWVCFDKSSLIYFDSYGIKPIKEIEDISKNLQYNQVQIQPCGTEICGQLCLYILFHLRNETFETYEELLINTYEQMIKLLTMKPQQERFQLM